MRAIALALLLAIADAGGSTAAVADERAVVRRGRGATDLHAAISALKIAGRLQAAGARVDRRLVPLQEARRTACRACARGPRMSRSRGGSPDVVGCCRHGYVTRSDDALERCGNAY